MLIGRRQLIKSIFIRYYDTLIDLQRENYDYYEKNTEFFKEKQERFQKKVDKYRKREKELTKNYKHFEDAFEKGRFINEQFSQIDIEELYKIPENIKLPAWFEYFKQEELEKVRTELDVLGCRLYRSKITESMKSDRKKIQKNIHKLLHELEEKYVDPLDLPIEKINQLQHYIEELQVFDRVIPEITYELMHKASEYARAIVTAFVEFREKSSKYILQNIK